MGNSIKNTLTIYYQAGVHLMASIAANPRKHNTFANNTEYSQKYVEHQVQNSKLERSDLTLGPIQEDKRLRGGDGSADGGVDSEREDLREEVRSLQAENMRLQQQLVQYRIDTSWLV